jgi:eukaryotic-like serine/threonine-protein kinase
LADDLRAFHEGRPIKARRASLPELAVRWARKHRRTSMVAAVSAGVSLVLVAAGLAGWQQHHRSKLGELVLTERF